MSDSMFDKLVWLDKNDNPFGVRCLDCRSFSQSMVATTKNADTARLFLDLRESTGEQHRGQVPLNAMVVQCDLRYPPNGQSKDGPLFIAEEMEDKWDIYHYDGCLYFARSWTGKLVFRATMQSTNQEAIVNSIAADAQVASQDSNHIIRQVDFLIKSHVYKREVPHPLPSDLPNEVQPIALYSFSQYGRWALFATYEDTTQIRIS